MFKNPEPARQGCDSEAPKLRETGSEVKLVAMFLTEGLKLDFEAGHPKL